MSHIVVDPDSNFKMEQFSERRYVAKMSLENFAAKRKTDPYRIELERKLSRLKTFSTVRTTPPAGSRITVYSREYVLEDGKPIVGDKKLLKFVGPETTLQVNEDPTEEVTIDEQFDRFSIGMFSKDRRTFPGCHVRDEEVTVTDMYEIAHANLNPHFIVAKRCPTSNSQYPFHYKVGSFRTSAHPVKVEVDKPSGETVEVLLK